jgi:hypothetical protein
VQGLGLVLHPLWLVLGAERTFPERRILKPHLQNSPETPGPESLLTLGGHLAWFCTSRPTRALDLWHGVGKERRHLSSVLLGSTCRVSDASQGGNYNTHAFVRCSYGSESIMA